MAEPLTASVSRVRLTGHPANRLSEARSWDIEDLNPTPSLTPTVTSTVDVARAAKTVTATTTAAGVPTSGTATLVNGLATTFTSVDGLTYTSQYDALERLVRSKDPRHTVGAGNVGYTTYAYKPGTGLAESVTDPAGTVVGFTSFDTLGRPAWTRNADNRYTRFAYNLRSQLIQQWGDGVYPVSYDYDATYGDRTSQSTYRSAPAADSPTWPAVGTADTTTFTPDAATGLLWKKTDATGKFVQFDYNVRGQVSTRKWARTITVGGTATPVTATYAYAPLTGELTNLTYNDTAEAIPTAPASFAYDRLGRVVSVTDAAGTRTFQADPAKPWRFASETLPAFFGSRVLTRLYEEATAAGTGVLGGHNLGTQKGRAAGFALGIAGNPDRDLQQTWSFSQELRFAAVSASTAEGPADPFIYAYEANSTLLDGYARGAFTVSRDYEPNRDLVTRLETKFGSAAGNTVARFDATYDPLARRQTAKQSGAAFADYTAGQTYGAVYQVFRYNARNELESSSLYRGDTPTATPLAADELPGRRFEYRYDSLGNRRTAGSTGAGSATAGVGDDDYTVNALNQYVARENNKVAVAGTAAPNATVSVATAPTTSRKDRAFGAEVAPANASGPVLAQATVSAALAGAGPGGSDLVRTDQRTQLVPARGQAFTYDADGNLTADGLWLYTYDAENRLVRMTSALPAGFGGSLGHVRLRLDFKYDYQGRRIEKKVVNLDTAAETLARRFIYEGWNLIAELNSLDAGFPILRSYTWGLDKWGGLTDSGGPGGLLQITAYVNGAPTGNYYPGYDQQGNVVSLTRASDGFLAAIYEYDPFGNPVRSEPFDPAVADQPFRYANKWRDEETGLVYYGHRYYSPTMGRFINQDPIGEAGGLNIYGFVGNNVVNLSDYLGWETDTRERSYLDEFNSAHDDFAGQIDPDSTGTQAAWEFLLRGNSDGVLFSITIASGGGGSRPPLPDPTEGDQPPPEVDVITPTPPAPPPPPPAPPQPAPPPPAPPAPPPPAPPAPPPPAPPSPPRTPPPAPPHVTPGPPPAAPPPSTPAPVPAPTPAAPQPRDPEEPEISPAPSSAPTLVLSSARAGGPRNGQAVVFVVDGAGGNIFDHTGIAVRGNDGRLVYYDVQADSKSNPRAGGSVNTYTLDDFRKIYGNRNPRYTVVDVPNLQALIDFLERSHRQFRSGGYNYDPSDRNCTDFVCEALAKGRANSSQIPGDLGEIPGIFPNDLEQALRYNGGIPVDGPKN